MMRTEKEIKELILTDKNIRAVFKNIYEHIDALQILEKRIKLLEENIVTLEAKIYEDRG